MSDLKLNKEGDLEIIKHSKSAVEENDIIIKALYDLNSTENYIKDLIIKAIKTPKGNLIIPLLQNEDIVLYDVNYGSDIYRELSEGLTLNFLSRVKGHIMQALLNARLINNISQVKVGALSSNTVQLNISYSDNTPSTTLQITL